MALQPQHRACSQVVADQQQKLLWAKQAQEQAHQERMLERR
jgi:hypothetical protein